MKNFYVGNLKQFKYSGTLEEKLKKYSGKYCTVLRKLKVPDEVDRESGLMYLVRFDDGFETGVFVEELY